MSKVIAIKLEWKYSPETYFEEPISIAFKGGDLEIKDGVVIAKIDPDFYHADSSLREVLTRQIENRFDAVLLSMEHRNFELSKPTRIDIREDGKNNHFLEIEPLMHATSISTVDLIVKDKDGIIVSDTKRDRMDKQKDIATFLDKYRKSDATLDQMLKSYRNSVKDPDDEFVHLYEIRDSLCKRFESKENAIRELDITIAEWDEIGKLANNPSLKQGRHRGNAVGTLRNANPDELEKARKSVVHLIKKYREYLETR